MLGHVCCILLCVCGIFGAYNNEQRFAIEPQDQTAIIGHRVTLPCRVINQMGSVQWTKDDFALGTHRSLTEFFRYKMIGSDDEGDFSLAIDPVTLDDDARYQCQVSGGPRGEAGVRSRFAKLTVIVPPEKPRIIQGKTIIAAEDIDMVLECISQGGKPPAEITWIDGLGGVINRGIKYSVEQTDNMLYTAKSVLKITPKMEYQNTTFVCQAQNTADRTYSSANITVFVKYAPKVEVRLVGDAGRERNERGLQEGSTIRMVCKGGGNPPEISYRWFINQIPVITAEEPGAELVVTNVTRKDHESVVKCVARNLAGKSEDTYTLDVTFGPRFRRLPETIQADMGTGVILTCEVEGNPAPDITWTYERDRVVGKSTTLQIVVTRETVGRYTCRARVPGFPEIHADAYIRMNGRPNVRGNTVLYGLPGDNVRLECSAYSIPLPERTSWSFNGKEILAAHRDYSIMEDPLPEGIKTTLVIRESKQEHYGTYNCSVTNQYGTDTAYITLKPQKNFPLVVVLIGGVGVVIAIVTMIFIIIVCQRKVKKNSTEPETGLSNGPPVCQPHSSSQVERNFRKCDKESDKSSNISHMKLEMRSGSSASNVGGESDYGARDSDSIITRIAVPLAGPVPVDQRYSINRFSGEYTNPVFPIKDYDNGNCPSGYSTCAAATAAAVREYNSSSLTNCHNLPSTTNGNGNGNNCNTLNGNNCSGLDLRYSATYGNPYLRSHSVSFIPPVGGGYVPGQPPPPPPYHLRNGSVPQGGKLLTPTNSQYILANTAGRNGAQATHV